MQQGDCIEGGPPCVLAEVKMTTLPINGRPPLLTGASRQVDWTPLIEAYIHDVKVAIIEALKWIGGPLSAKELWLILGPKHYKQQTIYFHLQSLATHRCIEPTDYRQVRGVEEKYYALTSCREAPAA